MYEVTVYPLSYNLYVSYIWAGLYDLAADRKIKLRISIFPRFDIREKNGAYCNPRNNHIFFASIHDPESGKKRRICIDLMDNWGISSLSGLQRADLYFKRSYRPEPIRERYPVNIAGKVLPFGLWYPIASGHETDHVERAIIADLASREIFRHPRSAARRILQRWRDHHSGPGRTAADRAGKNSNWTSNRCHEFEVAPGAPDTPKIIFLTRAFDPEEGWNATNSEYVQSLNHQRAAIIRGFRKHFGDRFIGGFMQSDYAKEKFPECLAQVSTDRSDYLRLLRECRVAITTTGLVDSIPAKLAEYIAATRCILSDPLRYTLPFDVRHGEHAMFFENPEQGIEFAERLLTDDELAGNIRENNYKLYQEHVKPSSAMWRCTDTAMTAVV